MEALCTEYMGINPTANAQIGKSVKDIYGMLMDKLESKLKPDQLSVKQVTTLPWHFTPKGALFGPIYGIYEG